MLPPANIIEIATLILGLLNLSKFKNTIYKYFLFFIGYVVLTESLSAFLQSFYDIKTRFIYNIYILVSFLFYFIFFKKIVKNQKIKNLLTIFSILFLLFYSYELFILKSDFNNQLYSYSFVLGAI